MAAVSVCSRLKSRSCDLISSATISVKMSCIEVGIRTLIVESCGDQSNLPNIPSVGIITSPKWYGRPFTYLDLSTTKGRRSSSFPKETHSRSYSCGFSGNSTHQALRNPFWLSLKRSETRFGSVTICSGEPGGDRGRWFGEATSRMLSFPSSAKGPRRSRCVEFGAPRHNAIGRKYKYHITVVPKCM